MQSLGKFSFEINVIPNGLEKYMSLNIKNKISFVGSSQYLSSSEDSFVKKLDKDDFRCLS